MTAPDPDFLYKLALPLASILPSSAPRPSGPASGQSQVVEPVIPGTGPYTVASFSPGRELVLKRNDRFHLFSPDAQPAGYPDQIIARILGDARDPRARRALGDVQRGVSDWVTNLTPSEISRLAITAAGQLHSTPFGGVSYLMLNTRRPPFNNVLARRAVSFALDRRHLVALAGGELVAQSTCQILPPTFEGYRPYCPYTKDPGSAVWDGVDLVAARRLVSASGSRGARVNLLVQAGNANDLRAARYIMSATRRIGFDTHLLVKADAYAASIDPRVSFNAFQVGWIQDYSAPSDFVGPMFSCAGLSNGGANVSRFCDPTIDRLAAKAAAAPSAAAAGEAWAGVDRAIVDQAPAVPLYSSRAVDFVSRRVGNYTYNPELGVLLDQLWVR